MMAIKGMSQQGRSFGNYVSRHNKEYYEYSRSRDEAINGTWVEVIQLLLAQPGIDVNIEKERDPKTAFDQAIPHYNLTKLLEEAGGHCISSCW